MCTPACNHDVSALDGSLTTDFPARQSLHVIRVIQQNFRANEAWDECTETLLLRRWLKMQHSLAHVVLETGNAQDCEVGITFIAYSVVT